MRTAEGAVAWMADQSRRGTTGWRGLCLRASRMSWGLPGGWHDANAWWAAVPPQHRHPWSSRPPLGAAVFFAGGRHGHVGISDGQGGLWHTDAPNVDRIGLTSINWPRDRWGFRNVGWASWLNGAVLPVGGSPTTPPPNNGGDEMPLTQADANLIARTLRNDVAFLDAVARRTWTGNGGVAGNVSYFRQISDDIYGRLWAMPFIERVARFTWTGNGGRTGTPSFQNQQNATINAAADRVIRDLGATPSAAPGPVAESAADDA